MISVITILYDFHSEKDTIPYTDIYCFLRERTEIHIMAGIIADRDRVLPHCLQPRKRKRPEPFHQGRLRSCLALMEKMQVLHYKL